MGHKLVTSLHEFALRTGENLWKMKPVTTISKVYDIIWTDLDFRYSCVWHIWYDTC